MSYRVILWDMDGTTLDTLTDLQNAVNHMMRLYSMPEISADKTAHSLGNGAVHLIECAVPDGTPHEVTEKIIPEYKAYYDANCLIETRPYPGILQLMEELKAAGCSQAIISNKPENAVKELAKHFFDGLLDAAIGEKPSVRRKPAPDTVLEAMRLLNAAPEECVYIGDTEVDIATAANAGIDCLQVAWGFRSVEEILAAGGNRIASDTDELKRMILN